MGKYHLNVLEVEYTLSETSFTIWLVRTQGPQTVKEENNAESSLYIQRGDVLPPPRPAVKGKQDQTPVLTSPDAAERNGHCGWRNI